MVCEQTAIERVNQRAVRDGWASMLNRVPWSLFVTLTFDPKRYPRSGPESWLSSWSWFQHAWLSEAAIAAGQAWRDQAGYIRGPWANAWRHGRGRPMWALALEPHNDGRLHAHGLLKFPPGVERLDFAEGQKLWAANRGKWCRFEVPRSHDHVCGYVAKYILKDSGECLHLSPNFEAPAMACC